MELVFLNPWFAVEQIIGDLREDSKMGNLPGITGKNFLLLIEGKIVSSDENV